MKFAGAAKENPEVKKALEKVVLVKVNTHEEAGEKLQDEWGAKGIPHFFLLGADGKPFGRWRGYGAPKEWIARLDGFLADPTPIDAKSAAFEKEPTEVRAANLGYVRSAADDAKEASRYFREAERLAGKPVAAYAGEIFGAAVMGAFKGDGPIADVKAAADHLMGIEGVPAEDAASVALMMASLAKEKSDPSLLEPYLGWGIGKSASLTGEGADETRAELRIVEALQVKKDPSAAFELKRGAMKKGWEEDADRLNELAWWCFENKVALEEAEGYARKGIGLAKDGKQKAMILDTAAEICNLRDNCRESVALMTEAVKSDPEGEHYKKQLARFQDLLAKK